MSTIIASLELDKELRIETNAAVYAGENLSTDLLISLPEGFSGYEYYLEFTCGNDRCLATEKLDLTEGSIVFPLPYAVTENAGRVDFQIVARESEGELVFKSSCARIEIKESISAEETLSDEFADVLRRTEAAAAAAAAAAVSADAFSESADTAAAGANAAAAIAGEAASAASAAASSANSAKTAAASAANAANSAAALATSKSADAIAAASSAASAADSANSATNGANSAAASANSAAISASSAAASAASAASSANSAAASANSSSSSATEAAASANSAAAAANTAAAAADSAADSASSATSTALEASGLAAAAASTAGEAAISADEAASSALSAASSASSAALSAGEAAGLASAAASEASEAAENVDGAIAAANARASELEGLYGQIYASYENGEFDGRTAYEYAVDGGFSGTEAQFTEALSDISGFMVKDEADKAYAPSVIKSFDAVNPELKNTFSGSAIEDLRIYSLRTVNSAPSTYNAAFVTPVSAALSITSHNAASGTPNASANVLLDAPLYAVNGVRDEIAWNEAKQIYEVTYRNSGINCADLVWSYVTDSADDDHYFYISNVTAIAGTTAPYFECGSMVYYNESQELFNNDIEGIAMYTALDGTYLTLRLDRTLIADPTAITAFFQANMHCVIIKRDENLTSALSAADSNAVKAITAQDRNTWLKAYTSDNTYAVSGGYYEDTKYALLDKSELTGDNAFSGNQSVDGNVSLTGKLTAEGEVATEGARLVVRDGASTALNSGEYGGITIKCADGVNDGKIVLDNEGRLFAGINSNGTQVAFRSGVQEAGGFTYWDSAASILKSSEKFTEDTFVFFKMTDDILLAAEDWSTREDGKAICEIEDTAIKTTRLVMVSYADSSKSAAEAIGLQNYNPAVSAGSMTLVADSLPTAGITVRLIIIGV